MKIFGLLSLAFSTIFLTNAHRTTLVDEPPIHLVSQAFMATTNVQIKSVTLLARERRKGFFSGQPLQPNRDIGFASVFLRIQNTKQEDTSLVIQSIQICNASDGRVQMASQVPQEIRLKPLENSENAFHLTNKTGYPVQGRVKAVITYKVGTRRGVIESSPVEVDRL